MTKSKQWLAGGVVAMALVLVAGFMLLVQPQRSEAADLQEQTVAQEAAKQNLERKLQELLAQRDALPAEQAKLAELREQIPTNPKLPSIIRGITDIADRNGVVIVTVSPSAPQDVQVGGVSSGVVTPSEPAAGAEASATTKTTQPVTADVLQRIPVVIQVEGSYAALTRFLSSVETLKRPFLVTSVDVNKEDVDKDSAPGTLRLNVAADIFMTGPSITAASKAPVAQTPTNAASSAASTS